MGRTNIMGQAQAAADTTNNVPERELFVAVDALKLDDQD